MILWFSPESLSDVKRIKNYIQDELHNSSAAEAVVKRIMHSCSLLKDMPRMGIALNTRFEVDAEWYYYITGNYVVFYRLEMNEIRVIRVLDTRTDYLTVIKDTFTEDLL